MNSIMNTASHKDTTTSKWQLNHISTCLIFSQTGIILIVDNIIFIVSRHFHYQRNHDCFHSQFSHYDHLRCRHSWLNNNITKVEGVKPIAPVLLWCSDRSKMNTFRLYRISKGSILGHSISNLIQRMLKVHVLCHRPVGEEKWWSKWASQFYLPLTKWCSTSFIAEWYIFVCAQI